MKKIILGLCLGLVSAITTRAQVNQYFIGGGNHEIATVIRTLPHGSNIIGGYTYTAPNAADADIFLLRVTAGGTILWQKQWGTPNYDMLADMIIAQNGDIVAVGIVDRDPANYYHNNNGFVFRVDPNTGTLINQAYVRDNATTYGGEALFSVCELTNNDIVAVGSHDLQPGPVDGMVSVFSSALVPINTYVVPVSNVTDEFRGVVARGNIVYISGFQDASTGGSIHDVRLVSFNPMTGAIIWSNEYAYNVTVSTQPPRTVNNHFAIKLQLVNNRLVVNTDQIDPWSGPTTMCRHAILRTNLTGTAPDIRVNNYGAAPVWLSSNTSAFYALTDDHVYLTEDPTPAPYDPINPGAPANVHPLFSDYNSLNINTLNYAALLTPTGNQTICDIVGDANGNMNMAGSAYGDPGSFGGNDIYWVSTTNASLRQYPKPCTEKYTPDMSTTPVTITPSERTVDIINTDVPYMLDEKDPKFQIEGICGTEIHKGCFDSLSLNLSSVADPTGCNITATVTAISGNVIAGYKWDVTTTSGTTITKHSTSASTDNISFSIPPSTMAVVKVTIFSVNMDDHSCCDTTLIDSIVCGKIQPCEIYQGMLNVTPLASDPDRNCCFSASVSATPSPGYSITGYAWTYPPLLPTYPGTGTGNPINFCIPSITPVTPGNLSVIVTASDAAGHQSSITLTHDIGCLQGMPQAKHANNTGDANAMPNPNKTPGGIQIYPNPTSGGIFITSLEGINSIQVMDITGRILQDLKFDGKKNAEISISKYATGSYTIKVNGKVSQVVNKVN